jgi:A/G-specific adenine glycosylase
MRRGRVLLEQSNDRWRGMWILPRLSVSPPRCLPLHRSKFSFTNYRITLAVYGRNGCAQRNTRQRWFEISGLSAIPVPSPHRRAIEALLGSKRSS